jgi:NMD protein affecting ribosome stability and mRNA decay
MNKSNWTAFSALDALLHQLIKNALKEEFKIIKIEEFPYQPGIKRRITVEIEKSGKMQVIPFDLNITLCPSCAKQNSTYFEGNLQLMNPNQEVVEFISRDIEKMKSKHVFLTDLKESKKMVEFFLTDQSYLKVLARKVQSEFGGRLELHETLFSKNRQTSKDLYRLTALLRLPELKKGDVISSDDHLYLVTKLSDSIIVEDLEHNRKTKLQYGLDYDLLEKNNSTISKVYPHLEVLDPEDYSSITAVDTQNKSYRIGQKVKVVKGSRVWIVG